MTVVIAGIARAVIEAVDPLLNKVHCKFCPGEVVRLQPGPMVDRHYIDKKEKFEFVCTRCNTTYLAKDTKALRGLKVAPAIKKQFDQAIQRGERHILSKEEMRARKVPRNGTQTT